MVRGLIVLLLLLGGCQTTSQHRNSSVVDYLYPASQRVAVSTEVPRLALPLRIGIAFTPGGQQTSASLSEVQKSQLLKSVAAHFKDLDFVEGIEIIPSAYLRPGGSFDNLVQLQRMFGIDVIALVSYDQSRFTDEGLASIAYWTLIGAYTVRGEKNSTHTLVDAVVYDIASRKLLLRAPGTSSVKSSATLVNLQEQVREDSVRGFELASQDLVGNLQLELEAFKERIKVAPETVQITQREGYTGSSGSGSADGPLMLLLAAGLAGLWRRRGGAG